MGYLISETTKEEREAIVAESLGNIEANSVMGGDIDVLVTDGFDGNIFLKTVEGSFAKVLKVRSKKTKKEYAMKVIPVTKIIKYNLKKQI